MTVIANKWIEKKKNKKLESDVQLGKDKKIYEKFSHSTMLKTLRGVRK
jgi:hypothetical protein